MFAEARRWMAEDAVLGAGAEEWPSCRRHRKARLVACREKLAAKAAETAAAIRRRSTPAPPRNRRPARASAAASSSRLTTAWTRTQWPTSPIRTARSWTRRGLVQGYNGQAVVTADQIIVAAELTTQANDVQQLQPMLNQTQSIVEAVVGEDATLGTVLADAGYWSDANAATETADCTLLIATQKTTSSAPPCARPHRRAAECLKTIDLAEADLNDDGIAERFIMPHMTDWCGTAGCRTLLMLERNGRWQLMGDPHLREEWTFILADKKYGYRELYTGDSIITFRNGRTFEIIDFELGEIIR